MEESVSQNTIRNAAAITNKREMCEYPVHEVFPILLTEHFFFQFCRTHVQHWQFLSNGFTLEGSLTSLKLEARLWHLKVDLRAVLFHNAELPIACGIDRLPEVRTRGCIMDDGQDVLWFHHDLQQCELGSGLFIWHLRTDVRHAILAVQTQDVAWQPLGPCKGPIEVPSCGAPVFLCALHQ